MECPFFRGEITSPNFDTNDLVTVLFFFQLLLAPLQQLNNSLISLINSEPTLKRLKEIINSHTYENISILPYGAPAPVSIDKKTIIIRKADSNVTAYWSATNGIHHKQVTISELGRLSDKLFLRTRSSSIETDADNLIQARSLLTDTSILQEIVEKFGCSYVQLGEQAHVVENPLISPSIQNPVIEFRRVTFAYPEQQPVFNNLSFVIHPNTVNVIVGQSSIGKSTIFRLLTQLFDQFTGEIFVNGQNINHISAVELQKFIVLIPQLTEFFDRRTLRENITVANSQASNQQVDNSLSAVELGGLIPQLDNQYPDNCKLEELSGGAQKRMGVARCLVRQQVPKIYIFDEPTTGLDAKIAFEMMVKLRQLSAQHTVLLITHYLKFAKSADQILFMYQNVTGTQLKSGSHTNLVSGHDEGAVKYQELLSFQSDGKYEGFWQNRQSINHNVHVGKLQSAFDISM